MSLAIPFSIHYGSRSLHFSTLMNGKDDLLALILSAVLSLSVGIVGLLFSRKRQQAKSEIGKREGFVIVTLAWLIISLFGAIPFILSGAIDNYTDAFFETISGFTTTGASILNDIEAVPHGILFWRSMTHWIGGMGIIVLSLAILPLLGVGGMQLFMAEVPGPTPDKIHPRIGATAKRLWAIYVILTLVETGLLMLGGMSLFDGLCHAFGTLATGGFSTQNSSIADYSPYIQYVIIIFMTLAGINFSLHYFALKGSIKKVTKDQELRLYLGLIAVATLYISVILFFGKIHHAEEAFRQSLFQVVAIITTTGFVSYDYLQWPSFTWFIIVMLMFTGGCAGSTGGGIKISRLLLLFRNGRLEMRRQVHPNAVIPVRVNKRAVPQKLVNNVLAFFIIYILTFVFGSLVMSLMGLDFESAIGATASSLGNIGPGIGSVGPVSNYAAIPTLGKWFLSFLMLLGRLELFTVLVLFTRSFWKH
ncbi:MAG: potassium transporter [Bacteroidetes bacterium]|nr:MAG: potassium transporter [Bacteroidota bacterium]PIE88364.1 MAG: potassium transporter [Bacteroidota bacterium]